MWNFVRLYAMPLMTYKSCPGALRLQAGPGPGHRRRASVGDNGLTWTYHLQPDVKFEDGTTVTSQDVKYAVERTYARSVLPHGPELLPGAAAPQTRPTRARTWTGPRTIGLTSVTTPNPTTIVFHLQHPFSDFDYVVAIPQTVPVPPAKDTGANYQLHPISTGPYMFQSYTLNKQFTLVKNPNWNPATDPQVKQLADKMVFNLNVNANDIDNRLLAGDLDVDQAAPASRPRPGPRSCHRRRSSSTPMTRSTASSGSPTSTPRSRRSTTWPAAGRSSTPPTSRPCRPPMAARWSAGPSPAR